MISLTRTIDTAFETDELPARFDEHVVLEITDGEDGQRPQVVMQDETCENAWIRTSVENIESLPELR